MEPARARDARPLRRHGEDLVRHGDAVEEEERARDRLDFPDCFARGRRLVAVEAAADEPDLCKNQNFTKPSCRIVASPATPSTRHLLDGVHPTHWLICARKQAPASAIEARGGAATPAAQPPRICPVAS